LLFAFFAAAGFIVATRPPSQQRPALWIGGIILVLFIGLRFKVGCDWDSYVVLYRLISRHDLLAALRASDPGYGLVNWLSAQLGLGVSGVNVICAAIFSFGLITLCRDEPNPPLTLAVAVPYLVIVVTGYTRESVAVGLVMLAASQYGRGAYLRMAISLLLANSFHHSAVIMLPLFGLAASHDRILNLVLFVVLGVTGYYVFVQEHVATLVRIYIQASFNSSGAAVRILMDVIPAVIFLSFRRRFGFSAKLQRLWSLFALAAIAALVILYFSPSSTAVDRLALYLVPMQIVVLARLPTAFSTVRVRNLFLAVTVLAYSLAVEIVWLNFGVYSHCWVPYRNYIWKSPSERESKHILGRIV